MEFVCIKPRIDKYETILVNIGGGEARGRLLRPY